MRGTIRALGLCALAAALALAPPAARADGTIIQDTGTLIASGNAPTRGTVTIDPCAPLDGEIPMPLPVGTIGSIGTMTGSMPAFPGGATGGIPFLGAADATLPGGTYDFTTYTVNPGVTITYSGAVTIRTTGAVQLDGLVATAASGASITFVTGGDFRVAAQGGPPVAGVRASGSGAAVVIDVAGTLASSSPDLSRGQLTSEASSVTLRGRTAANAVDLAACDLSASTGFTVQSALGVSLDDVAAIAAAGPTLFQAFGGNIGFALSRLDGGAGSVGLEASQGLTLQEGSVVTGAADVLLEAFGGNAVVRGESSVTATGTVASALLLHASGAVDVIETSSVGHTGTGDIEVVAFGGNVTIEVPDAFDASRVEHDGTGDVTVRAAADVVLSGLSRITAAIGDVVVRAIGDDVELRGDVRIAAENGSVDVRAGSEIVTISTSGEATVDPDPEILGGAVTLSAETAIVVQMEQITALGGSLYAIAGGTFSFRGLANSAADLSIFSSTGLVDVAQSGITTGSIVPLGVAAGGSITVESYGGSAGVIDASAATIRSGDNPVLSGDVTVRVVVPGPSVIEGYILPQVVAVKLNGSNPARSLLKAKGFLDTGPDRVDLAGDATLMVGNLTVNATLVADAKGKKFTAKTADYVFVVTPAKSKSSKAKFKLKLFGDFRGFLDEVGTGDLRVSFANDEADGSGTVRLERGRYKLGKKRGALVQPELYLFRAKAKLAEGAGDALLLLAGVATDGTTPAAAPEVTIAFGDTYIVTIPAAAFTGPTKDRFVAKSPVPGVKVVVIDYLRETLAFKASGVELGAFEVGDSSQVTVRIGVGGDVSTVRVRLGQKGNKLGY